MKMQRLILDFYKPTVLKSLNELFNRDFYNDLYKKF